MIYADYNGSAPVADDVKEYLIQRLQDGPFANPNAIHHIGHQLNIALEKTRRICAKHMGAKTSQLIFNSGATEAISQVFHSLCMFNRPQHKNLLIISGIEHSATIKTALYYEKHHGLEVEIIPTQPNGQIDVEGLKNILDKSADRAVLVAAMAANNETGVIQPFKAISQLCQEYSVSYLCDTTQYIGKTPFSFEESGIDYAMMSGHKIGAMTGTGILLAKDRTTLHPLVIGGGQENGQRGGTQHYLGLETLAVAFEAFAKNIERLEPLTKKREEFEQRLKSEFPGLVIFGEDSPRLASTTFLSYPGVHGQAVQIELESQGIFVTTSSACSDNEPVTSKVLKAMQVTDDVGRGAVRVSIGLCSQLETYDKLYEALSKAFKKLKKIENY